MMVAPTMVPSRQPQSLRLQVGVDFLKQTLPQNVLLQKMVEVEDRGLVGKGPRQLQTHEPPYRFGLVEQSLPSRKRGPPYQGR